MDFKVRPKKSKADTLKRAQAVIQWGPEPEFSRIVELSGLEIAKFYNWHHYVSDRSSGLEWLYGFLQINDPKLYEKVSKIKERRIADSFFWKARLLSLNYILPAYVSEQFYGGLEALCRKGDDDLEFEVDEETGEVKLVEKEVKEEEAVRKPKPNLALGRFIQVVDQEDEAFSIYQMIQSESIPKGSLSQVLNHFNGQLDSARNTLSSYDSETRRYRALADATAWIHDKVQYAKEKADLERKIAVMENIVEDVSRVLTNAKATRKPRKPKVKSVEFRVSKLKYQKEDTALKLVSIDPVKILGSQELWLYSTKYNSLMVYRASSESGLDVKGCTLLNYDEKQSYSKRLGRKPEEHLQKVLTLTKNGVKKSMADIGKSAQSVNGRINENVILLRAF